MKGQIVLIGVIGVLLSSCAKQNESKFEDGSYIVVFKSAEATKPQELPEAEKTFSENLPGGVYDLKKEQAEAIAQDPNVAIIEKDQYVHIEAAVPWGLDRIDQVSLPLNNQYNYPSAKYAVSVYVIDTGIDISHPDFKGHAVYGFNATDKSNVANDCHGHGTHVAGTIGSRTYGVAKQAKIYAVKVMDCDGGGKLSDVIAGVEWVTANHKKPAVVNMSLGGMSSAALDQAVQNSIAKGVTYVVAAGNSNANACLSSPARVANAITVGAVNIQDGRSYFSNFGNCVDIFAPGEDILSTWIDGDTQYESGTSMASPHVAGVVALYLARNPKATPAIVTQALLAGATKAKITNLGAGSPNLLLNIGFIGK
jgi:subtilisin family serine protease